jgi:hypothetical protein
MSTSGSASLAIAALAGSIREPMPPATKTASSTAAITPLTPPLLSSVAARGLTMSAKAEWRLFAAAGLALVSITFTDISPAGPWNDSTFTSGTIGLIGMLFLYLAWFRITFEIKGVVPTMNLWKDPEKTSSIVILTGLAILGIAYAVGRLEFFPEPAGLVLSLVGLLVTTNGVYVWLSSAGPLASHEEE